MDYNISKIKLNNFEEFEQLAKKEICENKFHQLTKKSLNLQIQIYYFVAKLMHLGN